MINYYNVFDVFSFLGCDGSYSLTPSYTFNNIKFVVRFYVRPQPQISSKLQIYLNPRKLLPSKINESAKIDSLHKKVRKTLETVKSKITKTLNSKPNFREYFILHFTLYIPPLAYFNFEIF